MKVITRCVSVMLCMMLTASVVFLAVPQKAEAAAAVFLYGPGASTATKEIQVYKDSKNLYAGDFIEAVDTAGNSYGALSVNSGVTYKSSKTSIATVNKTTGLITPKKAGTTVITVKFKGTSTRFNLKVVSKSSLKNSLSPTVLSALSDIEECAQVFFENAGAVTKITTKNRYKVMSAYKSYDYAEERGYASTDKSDEYTYYVYSPEAAHAYSVCEAFKIYVNGKSPFSADSDKCFMIGSISGKSNTKKITVTLKDNVTAEQVFGGKYVLSWDTELKNTKTYSFPVMMQNTKTKYKYYATATVKQGSNKMTIETKNLKLQKGIKYKLISRSGSWLDGTVNKNAFTAK